MSQLSIQTVGDTYHAMPDGKSLGSGEQAAQTVTDRQEQSKDSRAQSYRDLLPPELPELGIALSCSELACVCQGGAAAALGRGACW